MKEFIIKRIKEHKIIVDEILSSDIIDKIETVAKNIIECYKNGGKVLIFGNGGSAADAQHFSAELINRFKKDRRPLPAISLTTDTSALTSIANDYGFEKIFEKQIDALVNDKDIVIAISTSGNSENVINAIKKAKEKSAKTIGFTNRNGGRLKGIVDICFDIPSEETARVQEIHELIYHIICELVEQAMQ